jgi:hypothetical protein
MKGEPVQEMTARSKTVYRRVDLMDHIWRLDAGNLSIE